MDPAATAVPVEGRPVRDDAMEEFLALLQLRPVVGEAEAAAGELAAAGSEEEAEAASATGSGAPGAAASAAAELCEELAAPR